MNVKMVTDPVCGMSVQEELAPATSEYGGQTIYFCSLGCKIAFDREPARWLGEAASLDQTIRPKKEESKIVIRITDLTKTYRRGQEVVEALRNVNLEIRQGEFLTVMGPSGGGKSTLLHLIGGIDRPSSGQVWVDGVEISKASEETLTRFRREKIGFVFQFYNLLPTLTATENVELPLIALGYPKKGRRKMADEVLDVVSLGDRLDHKPGELSGGQQQRVAIARAIVANPSIVLADEPTGDLDSATSDRLIELVEDINRQAGLTFLIVTHNPALGERGTRRLQLQQIGCLGRITLYVRTIFPLRRTISLSG